MRIFPERKNLFGPQANRALPLWMIFPPFFVAVYVTHATLLRLPYYWDEAGYYIPAAYDFFRTGSLIPSSTLTNGHPPLPSVYLALWWKFSGFMPAVTRTAMCVVSAIALLGVFRLGNQLTGRLQVAAATTLLTFLYPIWFAQSTLAHADMFAAAGTLWGLFFLFEARHRALNQAPNDAFHAALPETDGPVAGSSWYAPAAAAAACFAVAALCKETAIVTPLAIALWEGYRALRSARIAAGRHLRLAIFWISPVLPLAAWYAYHRHRTGYVFGNPEYLRYNATSTLTPLRIGLALAHRIFHLTAHMNMFVPVLCTLGALMLVPLAERDGSERPRIPLGDQAVLYVVLLSNLLFFSVVGGALLTRYLLPLYPLVLLICVSTLRRRVPYWWALVGLSAAAFILGLTINPPYEFAPEDNLSYADVIRLHQQSIDQIVARYPGRTVLTAWPATDELTKPELGYVKKPVPVLKIANFSMPAVQEAAEGNGNYSVALAFSTRYDPPQASSLRARNEALETRFFGFHRPLDAGAIAGILGGRVVWKGTLEDQWVAVLDLNRPQVACFELHDPAP